MWGRARSPPRPPPSNGAAGAAPAASATRGVRYPRWFWPLFAAPGIAWLALLFVLPVYVVLAIAFGTIDPLFRTPVPTWYPAWWDTTQLRLVLERIFGSQAYLGPAFVRTFGYVALEIGRAHV